MVKKMHYEYSQFRGLIETSFKRAVKIYQDSDAYRSANPEPVIQVSLLEQDGYTWVLSGITAEGINQILATVDTLRGYSLKGLKHRQQIPYDDDVPV